MEGGQSSIVAEEQLKLERTFKQGVSWFYWIAGLSIVNSLIVVLGLNWNFLIGLGWTQVIDAIALLIGDAINPGQDLFILKLFALGIDIVIAASFVLIGYLAFKKRNRPIYLIGIGLYVLDAILFLVFGGWANLIFHLIALWGLFSGFRALSKLGTLVVGPQPMP